MNETALSVRNLHAGYGARSTAIRNVSFDVPAHGITAIVGPNGAGKSTLMKTLAGVHTPDSGTVELFGTSLDGSDARARLVRGLSLCPERRRIFPAMTIEENLLMGAVTMKTSLARARIDRAYDSVPWLRDRRKAIAGNLSGGQQQLLAIWRAIMTVPRILLLDEPSLGLSPRVVLDVTNLIRTLASEDDMSVLIVEQNVALGLKLADHVHVLNQGEIIRSGLAKEIRDDEELVSAYLG